MSPRKKKSRKSAALIENSSDPPTYNDAVHPSSSEDSDDSPVNIMDRYLPDIPAPVTPVPIQKKRPRKSGGTPGMCPRYLSH